MAASGEKPYRVYRGGRTKGKVPLERKQRERDQRRAVRSDGPGPGRIVERRRRLWLGWTRRRWALVAILGLIVLFAVWGIAGYLSVSSGVSDANARLPQNVPPVLTPDSGLLISSPTTILLLGTDHATGRGGQGRSADQHSDSITLLHTDPGRHRLVYLSIPRDLRATIPGHGTDKINTAMQEGGTKLAVQTVDALVGKALLPVNHVVIVDFNQFEKLIDAVGGITVNVPENILSNRFDCPYPTAQRCSQWQGWHFHKGPTHLSGHQALILSRVRENRLDSSWTDFDRQHVQQLVEQATLSKLSSPSLFFSLPFNGSSLLKPIATDLSTWQLMQLSWVKFRAGHTIHCRLGGTSENIGGGDYIIGNEQNIQVIDEVLGRSAPQPPPKGSLYAPGCIVGNGSWK
jgi:LCP family protein required for cell wall assembly